MLNEIVSRMKSDMAPPEPGRSAKITIPGNKLTIHSLVNSMKMRYAAVTMALFLVIGLVVAQEKTNPIYFCNFNDASDWYNI